MLVGFIHRVMNIGNMSIAGETIDYGPCAFMDSYHRDTVCSSIDAMGRYAYGRQPRMAQWNLARFAETLLPHFPEGIDKAAALAPEAINDFIPRFEVALTDGLRGKLGLLRSEPGDLDLPKNLLARRVGFTLTFWRLCDAAGDEEDGCAARSLFADPHAFDGWEVRWRARLTNEGRDPAKRQAAMRCAKPVFILRDHLVEEAIVAAQRDGDYGPFAALLRVLAAPCKYRSSLEVYAAPPRPDQIVHEAFCGT